MKELKITLTATAMTAEIEIGGFKQEWVRTGNGSAKAANKVEWYDHFEDCVVEDIIEKISPLDLMYACGVYKQ